MRKVSQKDIAVSLGISRVTVTKALKGHPDIATETIRKVKEQLGVNQTLGASNISFGLPNRRLLNQAFLAIAIASGLTCPTVNVDHVRSTVRAADLSLGRDRFAMRYIQDFRKGQSPQ